MLFDTHAHIHEADYPYAVDETLARAREAGVQHIVCVGTSEDSSRRAIALAQTESDVYASIGVHPHDTKDGYAAIKDIAASAPANLVAVGEIGLDYFYDHSPRQLQIEALKEQIEVALAHDLAIIFHVRDAFDDFWPIFDGYTGIRGIIHSFTDSSDNLAEALKRGLYIGVNGISTFTKNQAQIDMYRSIPVDRLVFETDAPFLTPIPFRGKVNEPAFVKNIAAFHAELRGISIEEIAAATTANARAVFAL